jgi:sulfite reductase beta subunit-like hemoprotein
VTASARTRPPAGAWPDACPGAIRLHEAADGHLARVRLPGGMIGAGGLNAVAQAASLGNGIVELTSRAGLQIRGLRAGGADAVAGVLAAGGLLPSLAHDRVRNILAPPLGGRAPGAIVNTDAVVASLDRALCAERELAALPGRFLFAVDDGTQALASIVADVELAAEGDGFRLWLGGRATEPAVSPEDAATAAIAAARGFVALAAREAPGAWRVREILGGGSRLAEWLGLGLTDASGRAAGSERQPARLRGDASGRLPGAIGRLPDASGRLPGAIGQRDGRAAVSALPPLARLDPRQLLALAELVPPGTAVRLSPWRTLTFVDIPACEARGLGAALAGLGLIVEGGSGWIGLSACAGLGACSRARADIRAAAALRAPGRGGAAPREHWSGCERRCGEPPDAGVRVVATADGLIVDRGGGDERAVATAAEAAELLAVPETIA